MRNNVLPDLRHVIFRNIFVNGDERHFFGKSSCDKQVTPHLHIVLKVIERCVKVLSHAVLAFGTAEYRNFLRFSICRSKSKDNRPRRYFAGNFKRNASAVCRDFNGLGYGHGGSIA